MFIEPISITLPFAIKVLIAPFDRIYYFLLKTIGKVTYVFDKYTKHIQIDKSGNVLILHDIKLKVLNVKRLYGLNRIMNIEDGSKSTVFPNLSNFRKKQFDINEMGFYFKEDNKVSIDRMQRSKNNKELSVKFIFNQSNIKNGEILNISYAYSIPKHFPISNGYLNIKEIPFSPYIMQTSIQFNHKINYLKYKVTFDKSIVLKRDVEFFQLMFNKKRFSRKLALENQSNVLYNSYEATAKFPNISGTISGSWEVAKH